MTEWRFPSNDYGENKGINDSAVAQFRGTPLRSLAREICQNSLDAALEKTIVVEFNEFQITPDMLPGKDALCDAFTRSIAFWGGQRAGTTKKFFQNAYEKICADSIHMLRISDFNTSGLTGSREPINTHWTNLTKSSGVSDKTGTSGGSYGIGKYAPFACSDFSTVYYSTYDKNEEEASQGVARLVTFTRADEQNTQGVGYYGEDRNTPTFQQLNLDPNFKRSPGQYGTDIYIAGYKYYDLNEGWEKNIVISILDSFLGAIWNEKIIVKIGQYTLCKDTLNEVIEIFNSELSNSTIQYYEVLTSSSTVWCEEDFHGLGNVRLGLLLNGSEPHRKVAMIRKTGMKIMDQGGFSSFIPFSGIMFINGDKINQRLRELENPEHTEWQPYRVNNRIQAEALLKSIRSYISTRILALASQGDQQDFDVAGLGSLLPDEPDETNENAKEENVSDTAVDIEKKKPKKKTSQTPGSSTGGTEGGIDFHGGGYVEGGSVLGYIHKDRHRQHGAQKPYPVDPSPTGSSKVPKECTIQPQKLRIICTDKQSGKYAIMFVPNADSRNASIKLDLVAETANYPAPVIEASIIGKGLLQVKNGTITNIDLVKNVPIKLMVKLNYSDYCSMEVSIYANP